MKFDPQVHMTQEDWEKSDQELQHSTRSEQIIQRWMMQQYLDPSRFERSVQAAGLSQTYTELKQLDEQQVKEKFGFAGSVEALLFHLAIRDVFPHQESARFEKEKQFMQEWLPTAREKNELALTIETLYVLKRSGEPKVQGIDPQLTDQEFTKFQTDWNRTWGTGQLEDTFPDRQVRWLAMIRVFDPDKFKHMHLDQRFWKQALAWLEELRADAPIEDLFSFAFHLYLLSADEVNLDSNGKLQIVTKRSKLHTALPLPERNVT